MENYEGTYLSAKVNYSISTVNNKNTASYKLEYKLQSADTWTTLTSGTGYALSQTIVSASGLFGVDNTFDVRLSVTDYFGTVRSAFELPTAFTLLDFKANGKGVAVGKVSELDGVEVDMDTSLYKNVYMGGPKRSDDEKNVYFQSRDESANPHNCKLYGGNGNSVTSIGCWDSARSIGIWRYLTGTKNMIIDKNVTLTHGNGGDEFITSGDVTHASHSGRVLFSNGLLIQWGRESITPVANTPTKKDVTFAVAYTDTPVVITTPQTAAPGTVVTGSAAANITATGFDCYVTRTGTTATSIGWLAVGYRAPQKKRKEPGMMETIMAALITGGMALVGVIITNAASNRKVENSIKTSQAVTDVQIKELTREVRAHNNFAQRIPVVEEQIKVINHRLADLEHEKAGE